MLPIDTQPQSPSRVPVTLLVLSILSIPIALVCWGLSGIAVYGANAGGEPGLAIVIALAGLVGVVLPAIVIIIALRTRGRGKSIARSVALGLSLAVAGLVAVGTLLSIVITLTS